MIRFDRKYSFLILIAILLAASGVLLYHVHYPLLIDVVSRVNKLQERTIMEKDALSLPVKIENLHNEVRLIDSLLQVRLQIEGNQKSNFIDEIYLFADSVHVKTSKVEIGDKLPVNGHIETSISLRGIGTYRSFGKFVEFIENSKQITRVRQVVFTGKGTSEIEGYLDFIILEKL
jgi:hypothetical protein